MTARKKAPELDAATLPAKQLSALKSIAWGQHHFGGLVTGRVTRRETVRALERKGLVCSLGLVAKCDGDGFLVMPERYCEGFKLTSAGIALLVARDDFNAKRLDDLERAKKASKQR